MWPYHPELLAQPVPRYTSYPTAADFSPDVGADAQQAALTHLTGAVSLYVHIPYCERICWYCGCNTGRAGKAQRLESYLDALDQEIARVADLIPQGLSMTRIAFGGGSPNAISPIAFVRILDRLTTSFSATPPVVSVELDPASLSDEWIAVLPAAGVTHASLGVQTFDPQVQAAIGRIQPTATIARAVDSLRGQGVRSLNFDLMYGLPYQNADGLAATLDQAIAMRPDRIALFGYAHVPHLLPRQRRIDGAALPDQAARFAMAARGYDMLIDAGYVAVGFDHFALRGDQLAIAAMDGTLRRNFQGFTDDIAESGIGFGASAISVFPDLIVQNAKNAGHYRMLASGGRLCASVGIRRSRHDRERAMIIEDILCGRPADLSLLIDAGEDLSALEPFLALGLAARSGALLLPTASSRPYARALAATFDPFRAAHAQRFSNAV